MKTKTITVKGVDYEFQEAPSGNGYLYRSEDGAHVAGVNRRGGVWLDGHCLGVGRNEEDAMEIGLRALLLLTSKAEGGDTEDENTEQE